MKTEIRFMNELFRIVSGALKLDIVKVRNYTSFLADKLEIEGDKVAADRLRKMLSETDHQLHPANFTSTIFPPVDSESRFPLLEKVDLKKTKEPPIVLSQEQQDIVNEYLSIAKSYTLNNSDESSDSINLLIYGPPGTGKSRLARMIANELGLDLYVARLDGLISSFLGSTSKNIRALFDFASKNPCVLFLDEFDAIAKLRGDHQELGELKRVVNSFLQNLDAVGSESIIIAATNHEKLLDSAIWRRFGYRIELGYPTSQLRYLIWKNYLPSLEFNDREVNILVDLSEGFSGSDIREVCQRMKRRLMLTSKMPDLNAAFQIIQNIGIGESENKFITTLRNKTMDENILALRNRNDKIYSHSSIAQLFKISKTTAFRHVANSG
jgi:SpoVK/Ycf46/Vps4 family AAA+-type ATPase